MMIMQTLCVLFLFRNEKLKSFLVIGRRQLIKRQINNNNQTCPQTR